MSTDTKLHHQFLAFSYYHCGSELTLPDGADIPPEARTSAVTKLVLRFWGLALDGSAPVIKRSLKSRF